MDRFAGRRNVGLGDPRVTYQGLRTCPQSTRSDYKIPLYIQHLYPVAIRKTQVLSARNMTPTMAELVHGDPRRRQRLSSACQPRGQGSETGGMGQHGARRATGWLSRVETLDSEGRRSSTRFARSGIRYRPQVLYTRQPRPAGWS